MQYLTVGDNQASGDYHKIDLSDQSIRYLQRSRQIEPGDVVFYQNTSPHQILVWPIDNPSLSSQIDVETWSPIGLVLMTPTMTQHLYVGREEAGKTVIVGLCDLEKDPNMNGNVTVATSTGQIATAEYHADQLLHNLYIQNQTDSAVPSPFGFNRLYDCAHDDSSEWVVRSSANPDLGWNFRADAMLTERATLAVPYTSNGSPLDSIIQQYLPDGTPESGTGLLTATFNGHGWTYQNETGSVATRNFTRIHTGYTYDRSAIRPRLLWASTVSWWIPSPGEALAIQAAARRINYSIQQLKEIYASKLGTLSSQNIPFYFTELDHNSWYHTSGTIDPGQEVSMAFHVGNHQMKMVNNSSKAQEGRVRPLACLASNPSNIDNTFSWPF